MIPPNQTNHKRILNLTLAIVLFISTFIPAYTQTHATPAPQSTHVYDIPNTAFLCGTQEPSANIIQAKFEPEGDQIRVTVAKCDGTPFSQNGAIQIINDDSGAFDNYTYSTANDDYHCGAGDIIEFKLVPWADGKQLRGTARKCDGGAFSQPGDMYVYADGNQIAGPEQYLDGNTSESIIFTPLLLDAAGPHTYQAYFQSVNNAPGDYIISGSVSAQEEYHSYLDLNESLAQGQTSVSFTFDPADSGLTGNHKYQVHLFSDGNEYPHRSGILEAGYEEVGPAIGDSQLLKIVLDPGHGWTSDIGAVYNNVAEHEINLDVALRTKALLEQQGVEVLMTRTRNEPSLPLSTAVDFVNGQQRKPQLVVSIHANAFNGTLSGTEAYHTTSNPTDEQSKAIGQSIVRRIAQKVGIPNRGVKPEYQSSFDRLYISSMNVPASLVELAFMDNADEFNLLRNQPGLFAEAIAEGVLDYLSIPSAPPADGAVRFYLPFRSDAATGGLGGVTISRTGLLYRDIYAGLGYSTVTQNDCRSVQDSLCLGYAGDYHDHNDRFNFARGSIDFQMPWGTPVLAAASGTVESVASSGCEVAIRHADNSVAYYIHLSSASVKAGNPVRQGDLIGKSGDDPCGSHSTGPHLHFAVWQGSQEIAVRFEDQSAQQHDGYLIPSKTSGSLTFTYVANGQLVWDGPTEEDPAPVSYGHFPDVTPALEWFPYVEALFSLGAVRGYSDGLYHPNGPDELAYVTRGQIAKIIVLLLNEERSYTDGDLPFPDVPASHVFYSMVRRIAELGIVGGYSDGTYRPDDRLTRGQIAKIVVGAQQVQAGDSPSEPFYANCVPPFPDVPCDSTFYGYIRLLSEMGVVNGYSDGEYKPDNFVEHGQVAKIVIRALDLEEQMPSFYDVLPDSPFFTYVQGLLENNITDGCTSEYATIGKFCAADSLTRGQLAKFIIRSLGEEPFYSDDTVNPFPDVTNSNTFYHEIRRLKELEITDGFSDGTFRAGDFVTRAEASKLIVRAMEIHGIECPAGAGPTFNDVPNSNQFFYDIHCLRQLNIVSGYSDGLFRPDELISREQSAKVLYLAFVQEIPARPEEASEVDGSNDQIETAPIMEVLDATDDSIVLDEPPAERLVTAKNDEDFIKLEEIQIDEDLAPDEEIEVEVEVTEMSPNVDGRLLVIETKDGKTTDNVLAEKPLKGKNKSESIIFKPKAPDLQNIQAAALQNVLSDGDFEQGIGTLWVQNSALEYRLIYNNTELEVTPRSGSRAAWLGGDDNEIAALEQSVTIPSTAPELTFWYISSSADECGYDVMGVLIGSTVVDTLDLCADTNTSAWTARTIDLSAYAGQSTTLQLRVETDESNVSHFFIDDVSIIGSDTAIQNAGYVIKVESNNAFAERGSQIYISATKRRVTTTSPPAEEPPAEDPPAEDPPAEDPPAEDPPAEDPPAEDPPAEDPPAEDPPAEDPPAEDPPAEDPPAEDPPAEDPPEGEDSLDSIYLPFTAANNNRLQSANIPKPTVGQPLNPKDETHKILGYESATEIPGGRVFPHRGGK